MEKDYQTVLMLKEELSCKHVSLVEIKPSNVVSKTT